MSAFALLQERSSTFDRHTGLSCENRQELFVDLPVVVEDGASQLLFSPGKDRSVRVIDVAAREHLVAVAARVEEVDRLTAGYPVARRADVEGDALLGDDVRRFQHLAPVIEDEAGVMELPFHRLPDERDVVWLVGA